MQQQTGKVVRLDQDNWAFVAQEARPLEDGFNFNSTLRRLFREVLSMRQEIAGLGGHRNEKGASTSSAHSLDELKAPLQGVLVELKVRLKVAVEAGDIVKTLAISKA